MNDEATVVQWRGHDGEAEYDIVWKMCRCVTNDCAVVVGLRILGETNESRADVCRPMFAKFRTSRARVVCLVCDERMYEEHRCTEAESCDYWFSLNEHPGDPVPLRFRVGEDVVAHAWNDADLNSVCAPGIHYYKSFEAARTHFTTFRKDCGCERNQLGCNGYVPWSARLEKKVLPNVDENDRPWQQHSNFVHGGEKNDIQWSNVSFAQPSHQKTQQGLLERVERELYRGLDDAQLCRLRPRIPWVNWSGCIKKRMC